MLKEIPERPPRPQSDPVTRAGRGPSDSRLPAMSRILLFIFPALFAAAAALLWEPASEFLGGLQQPLQGDDYTFTKGFPNLKLNDGRYIPVVSTSPRISPRQECLTDTKHRLHMALALPTAKEGAKTSIRVLSM